MFYGISIYTILNSLREINRLAKITEQKITFDHIIPPPTNCGRIKNFNEDIDAQSKNEYECNDARWKYPKSVLFEILWGSLTVFGIKEGKL